MLGGKCCCGICPATGTRPKIGIWRWISRAADGAFARLTSIWDLHEPHVITHNIGGAVALGADLLHEVDYAGLSCKTQ